MKKQVWTHNLKESKDFRRELRTHGTAAEAVLWSSLKAKQLGGYIWRRQFSIGPYILDFYCPECRLAVELDGAGHYTHGGSDADYARSEYLLNEHGIRVLRFENRVLHHCLEEVLEIIKTACQERHTRKK